MAKKVTHRNVAVVLARLAVFLDRNGKDCPGVIDSLNEWMDEQANDDVFGAEAQNDPRGDQRD